MKIVQRVAAFFFTALVMGFWFWDKHLYPALTKKRFLTAEQRRLREPDSIQKDTE